jgi:hypothetical protein
MQGSPHVASSEDEREEGEERLWCLKKLLEEESLPTDECECRGDAMGLSVGVEWTDVAIFVSPSSESRDGLCT